MNIIKKSREVFGRFPRSMMFAAVFLAVAFFLTICLSKIGVWSVWFDESFSSFMIKQDFADIWNYTALDVNAPLYYYLLKIWSMMVGSSDVALRLLSVLFGLGVLVSGFFLARRLFGQRIGYLALLFLTFSPILLRYSTEMRCYTLLIFLLIMATYVFVLASKKPSRKLWLIYGVLIALSMWTHYYAALPILAQMAWRALKLRKKFFTRDFIIGIVFSAVLFLSWLPIMIKQMAVIQGAGFWIPAFGFGTLGNFLGEVTAYSTVDRLNDFVALALIIALVLMAVLLVQGWRTLTKKGRLNAWLILFLVFLPPLILAILSMPPLRPMFINRYVMFSMIMFSLLAALAAGLKLKTRTLKVAQIAFLVLMLALAGWGIRNVLYFGNYNFETNSVSLAKNLMSEIASNSTEKTIVVAESTWIFYDADVYATDKNPVYFLDNSTNYEYGSLAMLRDDSSHKILNLKKFVQPGQKIWFISSSSRLLGVSGGDGLPNEFENWQLLRTLSTTDSINGKTSFSAAEYLVK
jgi:uncharacterized membrane protein